MTNRKRKIYTAIIFIGSLALIITTFVSAFLY